MKESISNAMVFNIVIVFVIILIGFFVGSLSYSKAYKVTNRIVEVLEKERDYNEAAKEEIKQWLENGTEAGSGIGYRRNTNPGANNSCPSFNAPNGGTVTNETLTNDYEYCVYRVEDCAKEGKKCGYYYHVTSFMYFDVPIVGDLIRIPVSGETMTFTDINT